MPHCENLCPSMPHAIASVLIAAIAAKFRKSFSWKIIKIVASRCQILRLKCTKFNFGWGSVPGPAGRAYSAPLLDLTGPTKGREERERELNRASLDLVPPFFFLRH